ncbi:MAG: hypothetical protein JST75_08130 [Bacteroidetes bacterium]|nr:hypothetical protein [Bacteroidota bacterium]
MKNNNSVTVLVFEYNLAAIFGLVLVSISILIFLFFLLVSAPGYLWLCLPIAFVIIYIRYAEKAPFKARIINKNNLTFSTDGIKYGDDYYPARQIEAVAIYLYSFENFEYRDGFVNGGRGESVYVRAHGDQNKISFRSQGNVLDFDFYIDDYARFCAVRQVANDWVAEGINVVLKQPFDDDFIVQEMNYYNTPSGL